MASCLMTGAVVSFHEYGCVARADIFEVGETFVVQLGSSFERASSFEWRDRAAATHRLEVGRGYFHKERGVAVVPREALKEI